MVLSYYSIGIIITQMHFKHKDLSLFTLTKMDKSNKSNIKTLVYMEFTPQIMESYLDLYGLILGIMGMLGVYR